MKVYLGRHVYGFAAILFGLIAFVWHDFNGPWQQIRALGEVPHREILVYLAAVIELVGGIAIQFRKSARVGALMLAAIFFLWGLMWVPHILAEPRVYDRWGNFFEQYSLVSGALVAFAMASPESERFAKIARFGYYSFGICVVSFTLEQLFYLSGTASFVPKWIPPGQMFWAVVTTIAFVLAAIALLSGRFALSASRWLVVMLVGFGLLVWLPRPFDDPHALIN